MSPNMFSVTTTSSVSGEARPPSRSCRRARDAARRPGTPAASSVTTRRQSRDVSSTFALSTETSRPLRLTGASSNAAARRRVRPATGGTRTCRTPCRRRARRARRSRGRRRARARRGGRRRPAPRAAGSRRRRAPAAARAVPPRAGRRRRPSAARRPRRAERRRRRAARASVSAGSGSPTSSIAAPPNGSSTISTSTGSARARGAPRPSPPARSRRPAGTRCRRPCSDRELSCSSNSSTSASIADLGGTSRPRRASSDPVPVTSSDDAVVLAEPAVRDRRRGARRA